jgi:hypothetical protein
MIVSASYRTDLPAFYGKWFLNRLHAGYCLVANPYGGKPTRIDLSREKVSAFVFWTKNITPFLGALEIVHKKKFPFSIQHSINNYPNFLEGIDTTAQESIKSIKFLQAKYGALIAVWRYDPIIISDLTPIKWHLENFSFLAKQLKGLVNEVVVSFLCFYQKTKKNLIADQNLKGVKFYDPIISKKQELLKQLQAIATKNQISLRLCSQPALVSDELLKASCVDAKRLSNIACKKISATIKGNRVGCHCYESRDLGSYDTCVAKCLYCYAVRSHDQAKKVWTRHDPLSEYLGK